MENLRGKVDVGVTKLVKWGHVWELLS